MQNALFRPVSELLAECTGLHFPPERKTDLERGLESAAKELGFREQEACARWLLTGNPGKDGIEILASHLTVGETYFFRDMKTFNALERSILPQLLQRPALRIWSAGCCTGEEPYSIAMLLDRIAPARQDIQIIATDVNPRFLEKAVLGVYGSWSFRNAPSWIMDAYFNKNGSEYELLPHVRNRVRFDKLNLAADPYPENVDLVFCRNVLMYFSPQKQDMAAQALCRSAAEGGWLIVSPAELSDGLFSGFERIDFAESTFYRKRTSIPQRASPQPARVIPKPEKTPASDKLPDPCAMARQCADNGDLEAASSWCEMAIAADPVDPARHYLFATVLHEMGRREKEADALRKVIYLKPDFALAHFALGNLCLAQGRKKAAMRHFGNASSILDKLPRDEVLPESEGMAAGRLADIIGRMRDRHESG